MKPYTEKSERILEAMGKIDEELVADAAEKPKRKKKRSWIPLGIAAAFFLTLLIAVGLKLLSGKGPDEESPEKMAEGESTMDGNVEVSGESAPGDDTQIAGESKSLVETLPGGETAENKPPAENTPLVEEADGKKYEVLEPDDPKELPMLALGEHLVDSMGFEGYLAYDYSELVNANPWKEDMELPALPVYENPLTYDEHYYFVESGADPEAMEKRLLEVADGLGLDREKLELGDNAPSEEERQAILKKEEVPEEYFAPTEVTAKAEGIKIRVDQQLTAYVTIDREKGLPEQYRADYEASYEELEAAAEYLRDKYRELLHMEKPQININGGDYHYDGLRGYYDLEIFEMAGISADQIIHYNFHQVQFYQSEEEGPGEEGKETLNICLPDPDLSQKVGNYPIISAEEAKALLLKGNYTTSVPYEMPGEEYIVKVELVYRHGTYDKYYVPYYRFYVELPGEKREHGLKDYGAYYVPAIEGSYISDMPLWDGSFN